MKPYTIVSFSYFFLVLMPNYYSIRGFPPYFMLQIFSFIGRMAAYDRTNKLQNNDILPSVMEVCCFTLRSFKNISVKWRRHRYARSCRIRFVSHMSSGFAHITTKEADYGPILTECNFLKELPNRQRNDNISNCFKIYTYDILSLYT